MKPLPLLILVVILVLGSVFSAVRWMSSGSVPDNDQSAENAADQKSPNPVESSPQGPYPKAVLTDGIHKFEPMQIGDTGSHAFTVLNDGDAPLLLRAGEVTCKCTMPDVPDEGVPPGESVRILLTWTPESGDAQFYQRAHIWTNDPENEQLKLEIAGSVSWLLFALPSMVWDLVGEHDSDRFRFAGSLISTGLDAFQIVDYRCSIDGAQVEMEPMSQTEMAERSEKTGSHIRSGYNIQVTVDGPPPIGEFRERLTVVTDIEQKPEITVLLHGNISGPYFILGKGWNGRLMKLNLGNVKASEGKSVTLSMLVPRQDQPMQLNVTERKPEFLQLLTKRDESFKARTKERYLLKLMVPSESPAGSWQGDEMAMIRVETDRESIPELEMSVEMVVK